MMRKNCQILRTYGQSAVGRAGVVAVAFRCSVRVGRGICRTSVTVARAFVRCIAGLAVTLFAAIGVLAAACNLLTTESEQNRSPNIHDQVNSIDLLPRFPQPGGPTVADRSRGPSAVVVNGSEDAAVDKTRRARERGAVAAGEGYDLNFENAPVTTVAKVILERHSRLRLHHRSARAGHRDADVRTPGRRRRRAVRAGKRVARRATSRWCATGSGYRLVPSPDAVASGRLDVANGTAPQPGYGITRSAAALCVGGDDHQTGGQFCHQSRARCGSTPRAT